MIMIEERGEYTHEKMQEILFMSLIFYAGCGYLLDYWILDIRD
jgi:hypothetical protein